MTLRRLRLLAYRGYGRRFVRRMLVVAILLVLRLWLVLRILGNVCWLIGQWCLRRTRLLGSRIWRLGLIVLALRRSSIRMVVIRLGCNCRLFRLDLFC